MSERKAMLEPGNADLSLSRQCKILSLSRSSAYYRPKGESAETLALMRRIDELFMAYPFYGLARCRRLWRLKVSPPGGTACAV